MSAPPSTSPTAPRTIEVFADLRCPFTHVGLHRLVERRHALGRDHVALVVRAWPLELVNAAPLDPAAIAEEVDALRHQVAPDLFSGFSPDRFASTSLPGLRLVAGAYALGVEPGERVSLALRRALFEEGRDITDPAVLREVGAEAGVPDTASVTAPVSAATDEDVLADWREGQRRGVIGSPHFFVGEDSWFCPSLDISRDGGRLRIASDPAEFDRFVAACLGS